MAEWTSMVETLRHLKESVTIALVGKYVALHDAYLSIVEALKHGGISNSAVNIKWVDSEELTSNNVFEELGDVDGILVPGGFGSRESRKNYSGQVCRENKVPISESVSACRWRLSNLPAIFSVCRRKHQ